MFGFPSVFVDSRPLKSEYTRSEFLFQDFAQNCPDSCSHSKKIVRTRGLSAFRTFHTPGDAAPWLGNPVRPERIAAGRTFVDRCHDGLQ
jgi:hypothetical protein